MTVAVKSLGNCLIQALNARVDEVLGEFHDSPLGILIRDSASPRALVAATIREIYWEIHCYQPATTKAGFVLIGAMNPRERKIMKALLLHKWEEVEHRVWALDGYIALGGDRARIGQEDQNCSPGAFAVAAVWERLASTIDPLAYLGAEYLFEDLTAKLTRIVTASLGHRGLAPQGMQFIVDHASEDERHSAMLQKLLLEVHECHPEKREQILFAFDCFRHVYPMPLWMASYERAKRAIEPLDQITALEAEEHDVSPMISRGASL